MIQTKLRSLTFHRSRSRSRSPEQNKEQFMGRERIVISYNKDKTRRGTQHRLQASSDSPDSPPMETKRITVTPKAEPVAPAGEKMAEEREPLPPGQFRTFPSCQPKLFDVLFGVLQLFSQFSRHKSEFFS